MSRAQLSTAAWGLVYAVSSTLEVTAVKGLNYEAKVYLPTFSALALNQLWVILLPGYARERWRRWRRTRQDRRAADALSHGPTSPSPGAARESVESRASGSSPRRQRENQLEPVPSDTREPADSGDVTTEDVLTVVVPQPLARGSSRAHAPSSALPSACTPANHAQRQRDEHWHGCGTEVESNAALGHGSHQHDPQPRAIDPSRRQVAAAYCLFSLTTYGITLLRNVSANSIPGGVFSLLISTSIVFNILLSRVVLKRALNRWHIIAAGLCLIGAAVLGVFGTEEDAAEGSAGHHYRVGVPAAIGAAFCIASNSVISDRTTRDWRDKDFRIVEMTIVASVGASLLLVPTLFLLGEQHSWPTQLGAAWGDARARGYVVCLTLTMPLVKSGSRLSKYETISHSSALFFEFVQAASALISAVANVLIFGEHWSAGFVGSAVAIALAFLAYARARSLQKADRRRETVNTSPPETALLPAHPPSAQGSEASAKGRRAMSVRRHHPQHDSDTQSFSYAAIPHG